MTSVQGSAANIGVATATSATGRAGAPGLVTLQADGSFTYEPPAGYEGDDTFTYGADDGSGALATVTITVRGMVWFVDDDAAGPANAGTFVDPFPSMAAFNAANAGGAGAPEPKTGDVISLRSGAYSEADGINLLDDQQLIGEGVPLASAFAADPNSVVAYQTFAGAAGTPPTIAVTDVDNHGIELAANNTVRGLTIGNTHAIRPSASFGMFGDAVGNLTVNAVSITGVGGAVDLANGDLGNNVVFDELSSVDAPDLAVRLTSLSGTLEVVNDASAIVDPAGQAVRVAGGSLSFHYPGTITTVRPFHVLEVLNMGPGGEVIITGAITQAHRNGRGVLIENVASDVTVSDLFLGTAANRNGGQSGITIRDNSTGTFTFSNVDIFTTGSSNPAIEVSNTSAAGTLVVNDARVDADGAPALDIVRTELDLTAQAVSGNSAGAGIRLLDVTGAATINTTSVLDNATGAGVDVQNTTGTLGLDLQGLSITNTAGDGISVSSTGDANVCLHLVNTTTSGLGGNGYTLESVGTSTFQLQDFTGDGSVPADVTAWVNVTKSNAGTVNVLGTFFTSAPGTCVP